MDATVRVTVEDKVGTLALDDVLPGTVPSRSGEAIRADKLQTTTFVRAVALLAHDSKWINQLRRDVYSDDDAEGIKAFRDRRPPDFT